MKDIWIQRWFMWHLALINSNEEIAVWDFLTSHEIHFAGQRLRADGSNWGSFHHLLHRLYGFVLPLSFVRSYLLSFSTSSLFKSCLFSKRVPKHLVKACYVQHERLGTGWYNKIIPLSINHSFAHCVVNFHLFEVGSFFWVIGTSPICSLFPQPTNTLLHSVFVQIKERWGGTAASSSA